MSKWKEEWKKLFGKDGVLKNKRLYIAVLACVAVLAVSVSVMLKTKKDDEVLTNTPQKTPTAIPTPKSDLSVIVSPPPTAAPVKTKAPVKSAAPQKPVVSAEPDTETAAVSNMKLSGPDQLVIPVVGEVMVPYSMDELLKSKTTGNWQVHRGVDIKAALSTAVLAAADGTVEKAYLDDLYGNTIILSHEGGYQTVYSNLATLEMIEVGKSVKAGQAISSIGDTASIELLEEAHLHFELLVNGNYKNPMDYIK